MERVITLLCGDPLQSEISGPVGLLFECAADSAIRKRFPHAQDITALIGDFEGSKLQAAVLARKLLAHEPLLRSVQQLAIFEELLIRDLLYHLQGKHLHDYLLSQGYDSCVFSGKSRYQAILMEYVQLSGSSLVVKAEQSYAPQSLSRLKRSWSRLSGAGFSRASLAGEFRQLLQILDPWNRRYWYRSHPKLLPGKIVFYSTAWTFTRIGLFYEPWFQDEFEYLVENPVRGGALLAARGRRFTSPYVFATHAMVPSNQEVESGYNMILRHLQQVDLPTGEALVRDAYLRGEGFNSFIQRHLAQGLFHSALFENVIANIRPSALVVGNPGFEGYALQAARRAGIPTVLLQHGILGDFCQFIDPPVDHYVVRGKFWAEFLASTPRRRAKILNPPEDAPVLTVKPRQRTVLFLTAPYSLQELWDESDLIEILRSLLKICSQQKVTLAIQVHPLEEVGQYKKLIAAVLQEPGKMRPQINFHQGPGLEAQVANAAVAITFASTAFLDCLRYQIPIVSFEWHDFSYKHQLAENQVFYFATSLMHMESLIMQALQNMLLPYTKSTLPFLADTSAEALETGLARLVDRPKIETQDLT